MIKVRTDEIQPYEITHLATLRTLAPECMVLLKKNGDFPLENPCEIAVYGSGARETVKGGTGSGDVNVRHFVTVEEGMETAGFTVTSKRWMDAYRKEKDAEARKLQREIEGEAEQTGLPLIVVGMGRIPSEPIYDIPLDGTGRVCLYILSRNSGEGTDRSDQPGDFNLTDCEIRDITRCAEKYEKFMLVLNVGGPVDLTPVLDRVENILLLSQLGSVTGDALADVILGKSYPSGRLTTTWARLEDYPDAGRFGEIDDTRYNEGVFVGYRWFDATGKKPLFPFGYGLDYAEFNFSCTSFQVENDQITVTVYVENVSNYVGKTVVQLYYTPPAGRLTKPLRLLGAYAKTAELKPGEKVLLNLTMPLDYMASWDGANDRWIIEKGDYVISLNACAVGVVRFEKPVVSDRLAHAGGEVDFDEWKPELARSIPDHLPVVRASLNHIQHRRKKSHISIPDVSTWTNRELTKVCVGRHSEEDNLLSMIGFSASQIAGGAGETATLVKERGFGSLVMADGPAGLRVAQRYIETEAGSEGLDFGSLEGLVSMLPEEAKNAIRSKIAFNQAFAEENGTFYHYASAIPIGTALAQAWNPALVEQCGEIVGEEMERFGVNVWLAPALNIHRSPLCGRNFEYYSEDPVISGKTAAAMTRGVQKRRTCAVAIKHFAANNQETNRYGSNSIVSQRALREIYLHSFEICIREAAPKLLMTSYNLINGTHAANRRDILTDVLRKEWGFDGVVITDWGTTMGNITNTHKYGPSDAALCLSAGNDLIMAGCSADEENILAGLKDGRLTREDLEICAGRVLALAKELS